MISSMTKLMERFGSRSLGIEITDTHAKWVEASANDDGIVIHRMDAEPLPSGTVQEGKIVQAAAVIQALQALKARNAPAAKRACLILPSILTIVRFLELPDVKEKHLRKIIDLELQYHVPLPLDRPYYDFIKLPTDQEGKLTTADATCSVMLVAAPLDTIELYASLLAKVGLKPSSIEIKALALQRFIDRTSPFDPNSTYLAIDITPTFTDISIYSGGALRIARNKLLDFPTGENTENDFGFLTACQELMSEVDRFINFYRYTLNNRNIEVDQIFVSGDIATISSVTSALSDRFSIPIYPAAIKFERHTAGCLLPNSGFAGALGAAVRGRSE